jgi:hypothetical protein
MYIVKVATTDMIFIGVYHYQLAPDTSVDDPYQSATGQSMSNYDKYSNGDTGGEASNDDWEDNNGNIYPTFSATVSGVAVMQLL